MRRSGSQIEDWHRIQSIFRVKDPSAGQSSETHTTADEVFVLVMLLVL